MLPKPEKKSKKSKNEQLDLVAQIDETKLREVKHRWLFVTIFLTIGLSFIFYSYRALSRVIINFKIPSLNLNKNTINKTSDLDSVNQIIKNDKNVWSVYVQSKKKNSIINIENISPITQQFSQIEVQPFDQTPPIFSLLPQGLKYKYQENKQENLYEIYAIINTPSDTINLYLKVFGSNDFSQSEKQIPIILDNIYWQSI